MKHQSYSKLLSDRGRVSQIKFKFFNTHIMFVSIRSNNQVPCPLSLHLLAKLGRPICAKLGITQASR